MSPRLAASALALVALLLATAPVRAASADLPPEVSDAVSFAEGAADHAARTNLTQTWAATYNITCSPIFGPVQIYVCPNLVGDYGLITVRPCSSDPRTIPNGQLDLVGNDPDGTPSRDLLAPTGLCDALTPYHVVAGLAAQLDALRDGAPLP